MTTRFGWMIFALVLYYVCAGRGTGVLNLKLLNFFHPIFLSESEFSEFENFQNKSLISLGFILLILKF